MIKVQLQICSTHGTHPYTHLIQNFTKACMQYVRTYTCSFLCRARQLQIAHTSLLHAEDYNLPELCIEKAKYIREQVMNVTSILVYNNLCVVIF